MPSAPLSGQRISGKGFVALALGSTVIWALYWIYNTRDTGDPVAGLLAGFCASLPLVTTTTATFFRLSSPDWQGSPAVST